MGDVRVTYQTAFGGCVDVYQMFYNFVIQQATVQDNIRLYTLRARGHDLGLRRVVLREVLVAVSVGDCAGGVALCETAGTRLAVDDIFSVGDLGEVGSFVDESSGLAVKCKSSSSSWDNILLTLESVPVLLICQKTGQRLMRP